MLQSTRLAHLSLRLKEWSLAESAELHGSGVYALQRPTAIPASTQNGVVVVMVQFPANGSYRAKAPLGDVAFIVARRKNEHDCGD